MGAGCRASTSSWEIDSKGKEAVEDETVVISVHTNLTAWTGEAFNFTLETPAPVQSVTSDIMQALRESESGQPVAMLVAIGAAATAVVIVASFLVITNFKFKKFSATRIISGDSEATVA
jgi:undecaprenyl pyrophosphate phosphatase UppP